MAEPQLSAKLKEAVAHRSGRCCEYCWSQSRFLPDPFSVEHILPRSRRGSDGLDNLAFSCQGCNNRKYNHVEGRDPIDGSLVLLYHPREQKWTDHFAWNKDYTLIVGLTPIGRATVERLQLNCEGVVNLRQALRTLNEHPPRLQEPPEITDEKVID